MSVWHCLPCLKEGEREREMNGIVIHSKVNENPRSLLVCQHEVDTETEAAQIRAADAIKSNCLLF